jgi:hypothetical protein
VFSEGILDVRLGQRTNLGHVVVDPFMKLAVFWILASWNTGRINQTGSFGIVVSKLTKKLQEATKFGPWMKITVLGGLRNSLAHFQFGKKVIDEEGIEVVWCLQDQDSLTRMSSRYEQSMIG